MTPQLALCRLEEVDGAQPETASLWKMDRQRKFDKDLFRLRILASSYLRQSAQERDLQAPERGEQCPVYQNSQHAVRVHSPSVFVGTSSLRSLCASTIVGGKWACESNSFC